MEPIYQSIHHFSVAPKAPIAPERLERPDKPERSEIPEPAVQKPEAAGDTDKLELHNRPEALEDYLEKVREEESAEKRDEYRKAGILDSEIMKSLLSIMVPGGIVDSAENPDAETVHIDEIR